MKTKDITQFLETIAPPVYQESYDNAGLIVGNPDAEVTGVLCCLDSTEAVVEEAIRRGCNLIVAHHPIVFRGLKSLTGRHYVERVVMQAIKNDISIYAIHTNLDNVYYKGVNAKIAERLGLRHTRILAPKGKAIKLFVFVPATHSDLVRRALIEAGAGAVNQPGPSSYATLGVGTSNGQAEAQMKLEVTLPVHAQSAVLRALHASHPDDNPVYDLVTVLNTNEAVGAGLIGTLEKPMKEMAFLKFLKKQMQAGCVKYTVLRGKDIQTVALCGGAGGFLLPTAIAQKADIFITADYKYHEFFDADGKIVIADIGHYESEQFTIELLHELISQKFPNFATHLTEVNTNPVNYLS